MAEDLKIAHGTKEETLEEAANRLIKL